MILLVEDAVTVSCWTKTLITVEVLDFSTNNIIIYLVIYTMALREGKLIIVLELYR